MRYMDFDLLQKKLEDQGAYINVRDVFNYVAVTNSTHICMPISEYTDFIRAFLPTSVGEGETDKDGRPTFMYGGIRFTCLTKEEADKYRILK